MNAPVQWIVETLAAMPWVPGPRVAVELARHGELFRLERGQSRDVDGPVVILEGEVELLISGRHGRCLGSGRVVGLDDLQGRVHQRVRALESAAVLVLDEQALSRPDLVSPLLEAARGELGHATATLEHALCNSDEVVSSPGAELIPGPYTFEPMPVTYLVMQREASAIERLLPPGVRPVPGLSGRYLILVSDIQSCRSDHPRGGGRRAAYRELTVFIPCLGPGGAFGLHAPELFASAPAAIMLGREVYGFPKRLGRIELGDRSLSMACDGRLRVRAHWGHAKPLTPAAFSQQLVSSLRTGQPPDHPQGRAGPVRELTFGAVEALGLMSRLGSANVFVHKRIATTQVEPRLSWAIDQLVRIPFAGTGIRQPKRLEGLQVELDPMASMGGHVVAGWSVEFGFRFGEGVVARDYNASTHRWREWWRRAG